MSSTPLRISFYTLGCKLNQAETAALSNAAEERHFIPVPFDEEADVIVVNSCTLTNRADRKTRQAVFQAKRRSPQGIVVLAGCYPQVQETASAQVPGADIVLGTRDKFDLFQVLEEYRQTHTQQVRVSPVNNHERWESAFVAATGKTRAFLKIQEGCDNFCTYCIVPYARGNPVSRDFENTLQEAGRLSKAGYREIVLSGIDIGAYNDRGKTLIDVVRGLCELPDLQRIRISSIEMNTLSDELIRFMADSEKLMPHFHLSLQSGSDTILKAMNRKYRTADFTKKVETIRKFIPDASIGTDMIVGFPGENDALFVESMNYINATAFSYLHIFRFSPRKGTPAASMKNPVAEMRKKERAALLRDTDRCLRKNYAATFSGRLQPVLWEQYEDGFCSGLTPHYIPVKAPGRKDMLNTISPLVLNTENMIIKTDH
jgi:threonylcarbamoyladenosine tRNA methylthiotransferase MtaB